MNPNCIERRDSTVAPQALHLLNNGMIDQLAEHFARRVSQEAGPDQATQVERAYLLALSRLPREDEKKIGIDALKRLAEVWAKQSAASSGPDGKNAELKALTTYCHAIMNSAGFLYVD